MLDVLAATFPFFALVLAGYVATWRGMLPQAAIAGLNSFVLYFSLPAMLFRFGATTPVVSALGGGLTAVWLFCTVVMVGFSIAVTMSGRIGWNDASFGALVATFPNTGYMGVPLLAGLLGEAAAAPAIATILLDLVFTSSLCVALSRLGVAGTHGASVAARDALVGVVKNPLPWSIVAGIGVYVSGIELPKPVFRTVALLADAASPAALFTIGAMLARARMTETTRAPASEVVPLVLIKLVVHPLLVLAIGLAASDLGLPLDRASLTVIVLVAALPSAANVAVLAERFGADSGRIARTILLSTAAAFLTFSAAIAALA